MQQQSHSAAMREAAKCSDMLQEVAMCSDMSTCLAASEVIMRCKTKRLELDAVGCESLSLCGHM